MNHSKSCAIEIKATNGNTIPISALESHQKLALKAAKGSTGLVHKMSDESRRRQVFDAFQLVNVPAYVVCCFKKHGFCIVFDVDDWDGARFDYDGLFRIEL